MTIFCAGFQVVCAAMATAASTSQRSILLYSGDPLLISVFQESAYLRGWQLRTERNVDLERVGNGEAQADVYVLDAGDTAFQAQIPSAHILGAGHPRVIVVAGDFSETSAFPLLSMGVRGLLRRVELQSQLSGAVEAVAAGGFWVPRTLLARFVDSVIGSVRRTKFALSRAELDDFESRLLDALMDEASYGEISSRFEIPEEDVPNRVSTLLQKFGVRRRADLYLLAQTRIA
jgi:DNA-binding NarL/FixJ family response regulator